jgi:hypothetical protein
MALVGGDDIQVHQDNDDHNDGYDNTVNNGNDQDQDTARTAAATGAAAAGGTGTTNFNLRVEQNKIPEFPNPDIQRLHYGESTSAEQYLLLQKICFLAKNIASDSSAKIKDNFDKTALPHDFNINDLVWFEDFAPLGKNPKLTPKWQAPAKITEINNTNARLQLPNRKTNVYNAMWLKKFFVPPANSNNDTDTQHIELDFKSEPKITGPVTRTMKKLIQQKEATEMAISILCDLSKQHC